MKELKLEAKTENLQDVLDFIDGALESVDCPMKIQMQIDVAVEEMYVNVAHYAYAPETGEVTITIDVESTPGKAVITLTDRGVPFDPTAKEDPDVTLSAAERQIGGLGIYMVKKSMDSLEYAYENDSNIVTLTKTL
ncbi:MAG: ATP-binding protein [Lachnospiraceae bacterium]|nr:ATP-binding protein [Lachnospiraceae bacterium]MBR5179277.1 ATP-binding protein [Lachnospiraceae bacterium]